MADDALLNAAMLESALASPRNHAPYEDADIAAQGAHLGFGLAKNIRFGTGTSVPLDLRYIFFLEANGATSPARMTTSRPG